MKYKIYEVLLVCLIIFSLSACSSNHDEKTTEITAEKSYFEATVLEKTDHAILVEPSEMAKERKSCDAIWVNINNIAEEKSLEVLGDLEVGDIVAIGYLGGIAESYPAQINDVYEIALVEKGKYTEVDFPVATATTESLTTIDTLEGVSMEVVHVTNQGIKLSFLNKTDKTIQFGDNYLLEMKQDEKWYSVDYIIEDWGFNSIAYVVQKDVPTNWDVDWTRFHGVLPQGTYRIIKPVMDFRETGDFTTYNLAVEFNVQ